jgi:hypothetical protein
MWVAIVGLYRPGVLSDARRISKNFGRRRSKPADFLHLMLWIRPLMPRLPEKMLLVVATLAVAFGCKPKIGDDCRISTDCSAAGDRLCDITEPGGYCTVFNCEPGTCPDGEALCVEFGSQRSSDSNATACQSLQSPSPYARSFCMATCDSNSDCRSGYTCANLKDSTNPWGAILIDHDRGDKGCVVKIRKSTSDVPGSGYGDDNVCTVDAPGQGGAGG